MCAFFFRTILTMSERKTFPLIYLPRDRIIVVTGANTGIGYEITKWSAMMGATVIMACRSEERARKAMDKMQNEFKEQVAKGTKGLTDSPKLELEFMKLDLSSFQSILQFCEEYKKSGRPLHVLVCNAAVAFGTYKQTEDGYETILQVNYLGHFMLIAKLLLAMQRSGPDCRIILLSSIGHMKASFNLPTMMYAGAPSDYPSFDYYCNSKLYQIMQTFAMARRLKYWNITVNCLHPGVVETDIWRPNQVFYMKAFVWVSRMFGVMRNSFQGANCAVDLIVNPEYAGVSGHYWEDCKIKQPSWLSRDKNKQEALWNHTLSLLKEYLTAEEIASMEGRLSDKANGKPGACPI